MTEPSAESLAKMEQMLPAFVCNCGACTTVDEDGCCIACGWSAVDLRELIWPHAAKYLDAELQRARDAAEEQVSEAIYDTRSDVWNKLTVAAEIVGGRAGKVMLAFRDSEMKSLDDEGRAAKARAADIQRAREEMRERAALVCQHDPAGSWHGSRLAAAIRALR